MDYLYILREALVWIITIFWFYQLAISVCSLVKLKDKPMLVNKNHRFMAIIPAHNESLTIGRTIQSIRSSLAFAKENGYPIQLQILEEHDWIIATRH